MTAYDKRLISHLIRDTILQLCQSNEIYAGRVEVDGLICITGPVEGQEFVVKVHESFTTNGSVAQRKYYPGGPAAQQQQSQVSDWYGIGRRMATMEVERNLAGARKRRRLEEYLTTDERYGAAGTALGYFPYFGFGALSFATSSDTVRNLSLKTASSAGDQVSVVNGNGHALKEEDERRRENGNQRWQRASQVEGNHRENNRHPADYGDAARDEQARRDTRADNLRHNSDLETNRLPSPTRTEFLRQRDFTGARTENLITAGSPPTYIQPECKQCSLSFDGCEQLAEHNEAVHSVFTCSRCLKTFTSRSNLERHSRLHTGHRPFSCTMCPKSFSRKDHLSNHIAKHAYRCGVCSRRCADRETLAAHYRYEHDGATLCDICSLCNKGFTDESEYEEHVKIHPQFHHSPELDNHSSPHAITESPTSDITQLPAAIDSPTRDIAMTPDRDWRGFGYGGPTNQDPHGDALIRGLIPSVLDADHIQYRKHLIVPRTPPADMDHRDSPGHDSCRSSCRVCGAAGFETLHELSDHERSHAMKRASDRDGMNESEGGLVPRDLEDDEQQKKSITGSNNGICRDSCDEYSRNIEHSAGADDDRATSGLGNNNHCDDDRSNNNNNNNGQVFNHCSKSVDVCKVEIGVDDDKADKSPREEDIARAAGVRRYGLDRDDETNSSRKVKRKQKLPKAVISSVVDDSSAVDGLNSPDCLSLAEPGAVPRAAVTSSEAGKEVDADSGVRMASVVRSIMPYRGIPTPKVKDQIRETSSLPVEDDEDNKASQGLDLSTNGTNGRSLESRLEWSQRNNNDENFSAVSFDRRTADSVPVKRRKERSIESRYVRSAQQMYASDPAFGSLSRIENTFHRGGRIGDSPFDESQAVQDGYLSPVFDEESSMRNGSSNGGSGGSGNCPREERLLSIEFRPGGPYTCSVCNNLEVGTTFEELESHVLVEHSRNPCRYCPKTFGQKANRDRHMCLHTGDKPYGCPECEERFSRGDKLKMHRIRSHGAQYPAYASRQRDKLRRDDDREQSSSSGRLSPSPVSDYTSSFRMSDIYSGGSYQTRPASVGGGVVGGSIGDGVGDLFSVGHLSRWMLPRLNPAAAAANAEIFSRIGWAPPVIASPFNEELERRSDGKRSGGGVDWSATVVTPTTNSIKVLFPKLETEEAPVK